jgi:hypothetical protein
LEDASILSSFLDNEHEQPSHGAERGVDLRCDFSFMSLRKQFNSVDVLIGEVEFFID